LAQVGQREPQEPVAHGGLAQFARDVFAQLLQHTRDGRFDVLGGRTVFQLFAEGVEQKLLFACLARRDHGSDLSQLALASSNLVWASAALPEA